MLNKIEEYNRLKEEFESDVVSGLYEIFSKIIPNADISVTLDPTGQTVTIDVIMSHTINTTTLSVTENIFVYSFDDPDNLVFHGSTRISIYKKSNLTTGLVDKDITDLSFHKNKLYSVAVSNAEIDLRTLSGLRNRIKDYFIDKNLVANPITIEDDTANQADTEVIIKELK